MWVNDNKIFVWTIPLENYFKSKTQNQAAEEHIQGNNTKYRNILVY